MNPDRWRAISNGTAKDALAYVWRAIFWAIRIPYGIGVRLRNALFDWGWKKIEKVEIPVICVGNLTLGGTGKTPCVEWLGRLLLEQGYHCVILSRGYGNESGRNDEAIVLEENLPEVPHLQGKDRVALAKTAIEELECEVLILDDGFQHRRLHRDLDIVLLDSFDPWGKNRLFPHGFLREPKKEIRRADIVIITRSEGLNSIDKEKIESEIRRYNTKCTIAYARHQPIQFFNLKDQKNINEIKGKSVAGFCGIGNPNAFEKTLRDLEANIIAWKNYPDHHNYTKKDVEELKDWAKSTGCELIVTTQKDWVKLRIDDLGLVPLFALRVGFEIIDNKEEIENKIKGIIPETVS